MRRRSRWSSAAAVVALAATLSGCLSVPHSGRVAGPVAGALGAPTTVPHEARIEPAARPVGAKPDAVVRGFYDAMVDYTNDHAIAKTYLADGAWRDTPTRVIIVDGPVLPNPVATSATSTTYELPFTKVGEVLPDHEFVAAAVGDKLVDKVTVTRGPDQQWRISSPPQDLRLSIEDFGTDFRPATLYFPLTGNDGSLIADPRWFPARSADLPAQIAQAYAAGPSDFLAADPRVQRLLPAGTMATADVTSDPAQLFFAVANGNVPSPSQQAQLVTALSRTCQPLASTTGVTAITLSFGNGPGTQLQCSSPPPAVKLATVKSAWFVTPNGVLRPWTDPADSGDTTTELATFDVRGLSNISLSPGADPAFAAGAVKDASGAMHIKVVDRGHSSQLVAIGASAVTALTWNADGTALWITGQRAGLPAVWYLGNIRVLGSAPTASYFVPSAAQAVDLDPALLAAGGVVREVRPSPDGVRISALVSRKKQGSTLYVARIDNTGSRPAIVSPRIINTALVPPTDKSGLDVARAWWASGETLVAVARQGGSGEYSLWDVNSVDGSDVQLRNTSGLVNIGDQMLASAPGAEMLARDRNGVVWELTGATWRSQRKRADGAQVRQILYPG
jgi:hypothetical protein